VSPSTAHDGAARTRAQATHSFLSSEHERTAPNRSTQIDDRTLDIANRLRFVCGEMPPEELIALARRMATVELKYLARGVVGDE
jgi:hypothetical protein